MNTESSVKKRRKEKRIVRFNTMRLIAGGFFGVILLGGILLWLPVSNQQPTTFLDSLFTSTSAVCVTGLVTVVPADQYTLFGKVILLLLIQIGGLGVIACTTAFFILIRRKITVKERVVIQQAYGLDTLSGMVAFIVRVLKGTLCVEALGALFYATVFIPDFGFAKGIAYSIFHAVSAFCNAGIDILGTASLIPYADNVLININTMLLIILGGLGFLVWADIGKTTRSVFYNKWPKHRLFTKLRLHSQVVLVMSVGLILIGTVLTLLLEYNNPETMGNMPGWQKVMASLFQSVTTRTAGFATISQGGLTESSKIIGAILMFIGGSPAGTAGGIKTTTIALLLLTTISVVRGDDDVECFGKRISVENVRAALTMFMISISVVLLGIIVLSILEPEVTIIRIIYECVSALATVGLTADLTPNLCSASRWVIIFLMYIGRIGPVTIALVFGAKSKRSEHLRVLPEKRIMIG